MILLKTTLVAYFSATGTTARVAKTVASAMNADLFEIVPAERYTDADLDWHDAKSRSSVEMHDASSRPALAGKLPPISSYDTILVGYPIWWGEAPHAVNTFLESASFAGKTVSFFATSGGSGIGSSEAPLKKSCPGAEFFAGKLLSPSVSEAAVKSWTESARLAARGLRPKAGGKAMFKFLKESFGKK